MQIPYFRPPPIAFSEIEHRIRGIVDSRAYTKGMHQVMLEDELQEYLGVDRVITCSSGTSALWKAMRVMRQMYRCKYIAMPAFNWQSDMIAAESAGYKIAYDDIDPDTWLSGPWQSFLSIVDTRLVLDTFGSVDDYDYHEPFIVDATHSLGAKGVGSRGLMECFSMAATKPVSAGGEGGFITTNDRDIAEKCAELRDLCARITEIQCVFALEYLSHLDEMLAEKRRIAEYYRQHLPYQFQEIPHDSTHSKICFLCNDSEELIVRAAAAGVECRKYYEPLADLPVSRSVYDRIVCLPAWVGVDVVGVVRALQ